MEDQRQQFNTELANKEEEIRRAQAAAETQVGRSMIAQANISHAFSCSLAKAFVVTNV